MVKELSKQEEIIIFVINKLIEKYQNNKGKIYLSNISTFFKIKSNTKLLLEEFEEIPSFNKEEIEKILDNLTKKQFVNKHVGLRLAVYIEFNEDEYKKYLYDLEASKTNFNDDDIKVIAYAINEVDKKYPNNKGKVYLSLVSTYFKIKKNIANIADKFSYIKEVSRPLINRVTDLLAEKEFLVKNVGAKGAVYVIFNYPKYLSYLDELENKDIVLTTKDLKIIVFAIICLDKQYPNNKGKIYLSNISTFFVDKRGKNKLNKEFGYAPTYSKSVIAKLISYLSDKKIIEEHVGPKGAKYVTFVGNKYEQIYKVEPDRSKEVVFISILKFLNNRCAVNTIKNILVNKNLTLLSKENDQYWIDKYLVDLALINTVKVFKETLNSLIELKWVNVEKDFVYLLDEGELMFQKYSKHKNSNK